MVVFFFVSYFSGVVFLFFNKFRCQELKRDGPEAGVSCGLM
jgi:hypothetical protein